MHSEHFSEEELGCRHCGVNKFNPVTLERLERLRKKWGKPMKVSSAYRCPEHNDAVSTTGKNGPHTTGCAIDILVDGSDALTLIPMALAEGFTGVGVQQKGLPGRRFIHLDDCSNQPYRPRPTIWSY